ncbi:hypothetical protein BOTBODRAFT_521891 [Botryobasidium botryosum FD-172 SS1]|uniref:F-box domain-containing protein n=1 Tax=Botryobasidium botryosum (strain FD-172 SS1) TaxID=930990 RepID=A0A067M1F9_BOTB1|nr:hypothetical protein BOTBODRAFT_521891 [Botryobasidium botryosum FD-172 SS1]
MLVCRDWIAPSHSHLLYNVRVHERDVDKSISLCNSRRQSVLDPPPRARALELEGSPDERHRNNTGLNKLLTRGDPQTDRGRPPRSCRGSDTSLCHLSFWVFSNGVKWGLARFRSLRELSLRSVIFIARDQLSTLLSLLPRLEVLSLADIEVWYEDSRDPAMSALLPKLHTIKLKSTPRGILDLVILRRSLRIFRLRISSFFDREFRCGEEFGRLLVSAGPLLKEFCADVDMISAG